MKFYQTLNQTPRSPKHGKHRRAGAPAHRHTIVGTDHGAGGSDQSGAVTFTLANWSTTTWTLTADPDSSTPPAIPDAGIRAGEIIGWRLWWLIDGHLYSLAHQRLWTPGETVEGNTNDLVGAGWRPIWGGTYAFMRRAQIYAELPALLRSIKEYRSRADAIERAGFALSFWLPQAFATGVVVGTIKMWGDVVEHEHGYRAQHAKLNTIDELHGDGDLDALLTMYGVGGALSGIEN